MTRLHRYAGVSFERSWPAVGNLLSKWCVGDACHDHDDGERDPDEGQRLEGERNPHEPCRHQEGGDQSPPTRHLDPLPGEAEERWKQREGSDGRDGDDGGGGGGEPSDERQAHEDHAEQRDNDGRPRERNGPPGGIDRNDRRVLDGGPPVQVLPVSGHDEQRVIDADTEAEHDGHRRGEVGDRKDVAEQPGEDRAHADAGEGDADGKAHGEDRPEGEDEHDDGEGQAEQLRAGHLELGEQGSSQLDLHAWDLRHQFPQLRTGGRRLLDRDVAGKPDLGIGDALGLGTLGGDLLGPFRRVGAGERDALDLAGLLEEGGHRALHVGIGDALVGAEHDRPALPTGARVGEVLIEDVEPAAALDVGKGELRAVRGADRAAGAARDDQGGEPEQHDLAAIAKTPTPELGKHDDSLVSLEGMGTLPDIRMARTRERCDGIDQPLLTS